MLKIVKLIRQKESGLPPTPEPSWERAINQIAAGKNTANIEKINHLFKSWSELDDEAEQKETLQIIESIEGISI